MTEEGRKRLLPRDKRPSLWRRFNWKFDRIWTEFRHIPRNIKMILKWIPVLWNNYDFDYNYLLNIMKFKMKCIREHITEHDIVVSASEIGEQIQLCEDVIFRLQDDDYAAAERAAHKQKFGQHVWDSIQLDDESDLFQLDMYSPQSRANGTEEQEREELRVIWKLEEERREADKDLLFATMKEKLWDWWD